jgi:hypothetical protein
MKAISRLGVNKGFLNHFDGSVEILDDLNDHWTAKSHKGERNWFVEELQDLAAEKSVRITILGCGFHKTQVRYLIVDCYIVGMSISQLSVNSTPIPS